MNINEVKKVLPINECVAKEIYDEAGNLIHIITSLIRTVEDGHLEMVFKLYSCNQGSFGRTSAIAYATAYTIEELEEKLKQVSLTERPRSTTFSGRGFVAVHAI